MGITLKKISKEDIEKIKESKKTGKPIELVSLVEIKSEEVEQFKNLKVKVLDGEIKIPLKILPSKKLGRHSRWNIEGREVVRKDLPKEERDVEFSVYGHYTSSRTMDCYQREIKHGEKIEITISEIKNISPTHKIVKLGIAISGDETDEELIFKVNLLRETTGGDHEFSFSSEIDSLVNKYVFVNWDIFPPGTKFHEAINSSGISNKAEVKILKERYDFLSQYNHKHVIKGKKGLKGYFGFVLGSDLVVFDNIKSGNALFILEDNWEVLSKQTKEQLSKNPKVKRVIHNEGWSKELSKILKNKGAVKS